MKNLLILLAVVVYPLCISAQPANESTVTAVTVPEDKGGSIELAYESYNFQLKMLEAKRDEKMWNDETFNKKKAQIPKGGTLKFAISNKDSKLANPGNLKLTVKAADGNSLHSGMIPKKEPEKDKGMWRQNKWVKLKDVELPEKVKVSVAHAVSKKKYDWEVEVR